MRDENNVQKTQKTMEEKIKNIWVKYVFGPSSFSEIWN